jgi:hypothetical protein
MNWEWLKRWVGALAAATLAAILAGIVLAATQIH